VEPQTGPQPRKEPTRQAEETHKVKSSTQNSATQHSELFVSFPYSFEVEVWNFYRKRKMKITLDQKIDLIQQQKVKQEKET
jgi:hypothetical protein